MPGLACIPSPARHAPGFDLPDALAEVTKRPVTNHYWFHSWLRMIYLGYRPVSLSYLLVILIRQSLQQRRGCVIIHHLRASLIP